MANRFKVLGQVTGTGSEEPLYTVPSPDSTTPKTGLAKASTIPVQTLVTSLIVCNLASTVYKFTVRLKEDKDVGDTSSAYNYQYIFYQTEVGGNRSAVLSLGLTLPGEAQIKVKVDTATPGNLSFTLMGMEIY